MQNASARPWFRLASIRVESPPDAAAAAQPAPAPQQQPPLGRPLLRLGSLLSRTSAAVPPSPQEPTPPTQPPTEPPTRVPTPLPPAPTSPPPQPPAPTTISTVPSPAAATQDQQQPRQVSPAPVVRAPSPRVPTPPPSPARVIRPASETIIAPSSPQVRQQQQPPQTTVAPPPPTVTVVAPSPARTPPRRPSPPLHPEPKTKPVVTAQPAFVVHEPISGPYKNNNDNNKTKLGMTQGDQRRPTPPPSYSYPLQKKPDTEAAVAPWKKKSATEETEFGMRVLTLAGENLGAHMDLGGGGHRGGSKGQQVRYLTQTQPAVQVAGKIAPASNGVKSYTEEYNYNAAAKNKAVDTVESKWKASASAKPLAALVNSNVQSVNNSIMFDSSCMQQSPGVHITLSSGRRRPTSPTSSYQHASTTTTNNNNNSNTDHWAGAPGDNNRRTPY